MSLRAQDALIETTVEILSSLAEQMEEKKLHGYAKALMQCHNEVAGTYIAQRRERVEALKKKIA